jgi:hypothetical protein
MILVHNPSFLLAWIRLSFFPVLFPGLFSWFLCFLLSLFFCLSKEHGFFPLQKHKRATHVVMVSTEYPLAKKIKKIKKWCRQNTRKGITTLSGN